MKKQVRSHIKKGTKTNKAAAQRKLAHRKVTRAYESSKSPVAKLKRSMQADQCHCQACQNGDKHAYPWQDQNSEARKLVTDFLNAQARRARVSKLGGIDLLPAVGVISWLRDTLDLSEPD